MALMLRIDVRNIKTVNVFVSQRDGYRKEVSEKFSLLENA